MVVIYLVRICASSLLDLCDDDNDDNDECQMWLLGDLRCLHFVFTPYSGDLF